MEEESRSRHATANKFDRPQALGDETVLGEDESRDRHAMAEEVNTQYPLGDEIAGAEHEGRGACHAMTEEVGPPQARNGQLASLRKSILSKPKELRLQGQKKEAGALLVQRPRKVSPSKPVMAGMTSLRRSILSNLQEVSSQVKKNITLCWRKTLSQTSTSAFMAHGSGLS